MFRTLKALLAPTSRRTLKKTSHFRPRLEHLETRLCPATPDYWQATANDTWVTGGDWSLGHAPLATNGENAVFDSAKSNFNCTAGTVGPPSNIYIQNGYTGTLKISASSTLIIANEAFLDNGSGKPVNIDFATGAKLKISGVDGGTSKIRYPNFTTAGTVEIAGGTTKFIGADAGTTYAGFMVDSGATLQFSNTAVVTFKGGAGILNNGSVLIDDNNSTVAGCSITDSPNTTFTNNGTITFTASGVARLTNINMSLLNSGGAVNITTGILGFSGKSTNADGYDIKMSSGSITLAQGATLQAVTYKGYLQTGGTLSASGSTTDNLTSNVDIKFNGGTVKMGDGSNTYNTLSLSATTGDVYIDGATFDFKVNGANSGQSDLVDIKNGNLNIDLNGGSSTMQWTINGTVANGTWTLIQDNGVIAGDFTTKNIPAGFSEALTATKWKLTRP